MRNRLRPLLLAFPLLGALPAARSQQTASASNTSGFDAREYLNQPVQVGAGTQGDVTSGSSGPTASKAGDGSSSQSANVGAQSEGNAATSSTQIKGKVSSQQQRSGAQRK